MQSSTQVSRQSTGCDLGRAPNTIRGDRAPIKWVETYRRIHGKCSFNDMKYIEIENDNLEDMIIGMVSYASTTAIPRYYVDNFEPPANTNEDAPIKIIATSTLSKYIGKIIKMIQYKFPMHEDFAGLDINKQSDVPEFWTLLRPRFEAECDRYQNTIGSDYSFGDTTKRPLYLSNMHSPVNADDSSIRDYVSRIDLQYILKTLVKRTTSIGHIIDGNLQHRFMIALTYMGCGRGGEVKFVNTSDWIYHPPYGCTS